MLTQQPSLLASSEEGLGEISANYILPNMFNINANGVRGRERVCEDFSRRVLEKTRAP